MSATVRARSQEGFTLAELLAVIAVVGVLSGVVVVAVGRLTGGAQAQACAADAKVLATAQSAYAVEQGRYGTESELVGAGLLRDESELHDVVADGDSYQLVPVGACSDGGDAPSDGGLVLASWSGAVQPGAFSFEPDGRILVGGSGERQAIAAVEPFESGTIEVRGARSTQGNGWGVVFHTSRLGLGSLSGYVFQMDTGYSGGRFVLRHRHGGESQPLAVTAPPAGFDWRAPHDVVLHVTSNSLRAIVDGEPVMEVADLAEAARRARSPYPPTSGGSVGLRLWHTSDLSIDGVRVTRA